LGFVLGVEFVALLPVDAGVEVAFADPLVPVAAGAPPELVALSLPEAALLAFETETAWWAALMSDWYWPRAPPFDDPPVLDEFPFRANVHSAKNTTVPTRRAINERDAGIASDIIGTTPRWHELPWT
jgi:hypothetical protein